MPTLTADPSHRARSADDAHRGWEGYTPNLLRTYDAVVLGFSNRFLWRCPSRELLAHYDEHVGARHLDIGPGTGWFLDRCRFPVERPQITLIDGNPAPLAHTARRIARYQPTTVCADILEPVALNAATYDSIALNYVLHCLPGTVSRKVAALGQLTRSLAPDGVVFGATILADGDGITHTRTSRRLMLAYNKRGIFGNTLDTRAALEDALAAHFADHKIRTRGAVVLFTARNPLAYHG